ncbi:MAG: cache domain-containing protein [Rhodocyclaceae bacterium]
MTMRPSQRKRHRLIALTFLLHVVLPLGVIAQVGAFLLGVHAVRQEQLAAGLALREAAAQAGATLDDMFNERVQGVALFAEFPAFGRPFDAQRARQAIQAIGRHQPFFTWIGRLDTEGRVLVALDGLLEGKSGAQRPVFINGREKPYLGDVHEALLLSRLLPPAPDGSPLRLMDISAPVRTQDGRYDGVLATHVDWSWVRDQFSALLNPVQRERGIELLVLNKEGQVLFGPSDSLGDTLRGLALRHEASGVEPVLDRAIWAGGKDFVVGWSRSEPAGPLDKLGWRILLRQPVAEAQAAARSLRIGLHVAALLLTLLAALLAWRVARRV